MIIGDRLRQLREAKNQSQGDIEAKTGLLRCYTSRVENGHTVPSVETLEKFARALEVPMYQLFYDGTDVPRAARDRARAADDIGWASSGKPAAYFDRLRKCLGKMSPRDRKTLFHMTRIMASRQAKLDRPTAKK
jgi:transcriptional regulator with XRE-family HTH domain